MDAAELEGRLFIAGDPKVHGEMFRVLHAFISKVMEIFPFIEAARPGSKSGIQALCSLHVALDKAKSLLQHCSECSKLYLAITGESIIVKFEKAKCALGESLRRVEEIVPEPINCQIIEIIGGLEEAVFELDQSEKLAGDEIISLLQKDGKLKSNSSNSKELEVFQQAALRLGISSSRAALTERRSLKKLIERARAQDDKQKESIVSYLYHLMRKYSNIFRSEYADDTDSQGSTPRSPSILGFEEVSSPHQNSCTFDRNSQTFDRQLSKLRSFHFKQNGRSGNIPIPPEEFICPISLQLMFDPVIISSGQTYERTCIEKWFDDGHSTCPKTQQQLSHLCLTPNYCVKGLIASWCELNGFPIPSGPPGSLDFNCWRLSLSQCEAIDSSSFLGRNSCKSKSVSISDCDGSSIPEETKENDSEILKYYQECGADEHGKCRSVLASLGEVQNAQKQFRVVEQIRYLLKEDDEARIFMGANGAVELLIQFLRTSIHNGDQKAQEAGAMALFNLAVNNNRNKEMLIAAGLIPLLEQMISNSGMLECVSALYLNLSCLNVAKPLICSSKAVPFLVQLLQDDKNAGSTCKYDALYTLYNLSTHPPNITILISSGIITSLHQLLLGLPSAPEGIMWTQKALSVLINLASSQAGRREIVSDPAIFSSLAGVLDFGEPFQQEQVVLCLLILCSGDQKCSQMVLQEGVIPSLVSISVNGTAKGREKAEKLLKLFRDQRQQEPPTMKQQHQPTIDGNSGIQVAPETKKLCESRSKKLGRTLSSIWKKKSFSIYQCSCPWSVPIM